MGSLSLISIICWISIPVFAQATSIAIEPIAPVSDLAQLDLGELCSPVLCRLFCQYGFKTNDLGCQICECNPVPLGCETQICEEGTLCNNVKLTLCALCLPYYYSPYCGCFDVFEAICLPTITVCKISSEECKLDCEYGFVYTFDGCKTCECVVPPVPKDKPGRCPAITQSLIGECDQQCSNDRDCFDDDVCCETGCGKSCVTPIPDCPPVCAIYCFYGNVMDKNGCPTCICNEQPTGCEALECGEFELCDYVAIEACPGCIGPVECFCFLSFFLECVPMFPECEPLECDLDCDHGLAISFNGCPLCTCNYPPECGSVCLRKCDYGLKKDNSGCPRCECNEPPSGCLGFECEDPNTICQIEQSVDCRYLDCTISDPLGDINLCGCLDSYKPACKPRRPECPKSFQTMAECQVECPQGYAVDSNGCPVCRCVPSICVPCNILIPCPFGQKTDENGCLLCECNPCPPECPDVLCTIYCSHGNVLDKYGCPTCECKPAPPGCEVLKCGSNTQCWIRESTVCPVCAAGSPPEFCRCVTTIAAGCVPECQRSLELNTCSWPQSDDDCPSGYRVRDIGGCPLCKCWEPEPVPWYCEDIKCFGGQVCRWVYPLCVCNAPPGALCDCPLPIPEARCVPSNPSGCEDHNCKSKCDHGYAVDNDGCDTCVCNPDPFNPCSLILCENKGEECKLIQVECVTEPCYPIGVCVPVICPQVRCSNDCGELGFKEDENGCQTCECNENACSSNPCGECSNCFVQGTDIGCIPKCPARLCINECPDFGYAPDDSPCRCQTCDCLPDPCDPNPCLPGTRCEATIHNCDAGPCKPPDITCEPISCLPVLCDLFCPYGFARDENGCEICQCEDPCDPNPCRFLERCEVETFPCLFPPCPQGIRCVPNCPLRLCLEPEEPCLNGFALDENGCTTCECNKCSPFICLIFCEFGRVTDENGCDICQCKPPPDAPSCADIECDYYERCELLDTPCAPMTFPCFPQPTCIPCPVVDCFCKEGFILETFIGEDGCPTCRCQDPDVIILTTPFNCPLVLCQEPEEPCLNGFAVDENGCTTCQCNPPDVDPGCAAVTCFIGNICKVVGGVARCIPIGVCPELPPDTFGTCDERCGSGCPGLQLCCSNGCGHLCKDPVYPCDITVNGFNDPNPVQPDGNGQCPPYSRSQVPFPGSKTQCCPFDIGSSNEPECPLEGTDPLPNYFCGRGGQECPFGYSCATSSTDRWAVCCPTQKPPTCDDIECDDNTKCELVDVLCVTTPCYPQPQCIPCLIQLCLCTEGYHMVSFMGSDGCPRCRCDPDNVCPPPPPTKRCNQRKDPGPCEGDFPSYYFNHRTGECEKFSYGGCGGNSNRFSTLEDCEETCKEDICELPIVVGPCRARLPRWGFDNDAGQCVQFNYGGCRGNENRFSTQASCEKACHPDPCGLPIDSGPCDGSVRSWAYDSRRGRCVRFNYGGCGGNENRFNSRRTCKNYCENEDSVCELPIASGDCCGSRKKWGYNPKSGKCEKFTYTGCGGNKNRFRSKQKCERACKRDVCLQPIFPGPCKASIPRYAYNHVTKRCERFIYGGCQANQNNFRTKEACNQQCVCGPVCEIACPCGNEVDRRGCPLCSCKDCPPELCVKK